MSEYIDNAANELANLTLAETSDNTKIVEQIGEILGALSQTLEEAYLTALRVRRAEKRARELLAKYAAARGA